MVAICHFVGVISASSGRKSKSDKNTCINNKNRAQYIYIRINLFNMLANVLHRQDE